MKWLDARKAHTILKFSFWAKIKKNNKKISCTSKYIKSEKKYIKILYVRRLRLTNEPTNWRLYFEKKYTQLKNSYWKNTLQQRLYIYLLYIFKKTGLSHAQCSLLVTQELFRSGNPQNSCVKKKTPFSQILL
jgi:hypothetical protein